MMMNNYFTRIGIFTVALVFHLLYTEFLKFIVSDVDDDNIELYATRVGGAIIYAVTVMVMWKV